MMDCRDMHNLKHEKLICDLLKNGKTIRFEEFFEINDEKEAFRYGFKEPHSENHQINYYLRRYNTKKQPKKEDVTGLCSLSCFEDADFAITNYNNTLKRHRQFPKTAGESLFHGILCVGDGYINSADSKKHFDFFETVVCDMNKFNIIIDEIKIIGDSL